MITVLVYCVIISARLIWVGKIGHMWEWEMREKICTEYLKEKSNFQSYVHMEWYY